MVRVNREEGETIDHLLRRYNDTLKRMNFVTNVKHAAFYSRKQNKGQKKKSALYRAQKAKKMEYLKRIGKIELNHSKYHSRFGSKKS